MKRKLLLLVLSLLMCASSVLVSCKKEEPPEPTDTTPPVTNAQDDYWDTLPKNETGYEEVYAVAIDTNCISPEITAEAPPVDQALYKRDQTVMEKLNININYSTITNADAVATMRLSVQGGGDEGKRHQVFLYQAQQLMQLSTEGILLDLNTVPVLDLDQAWWSKTLNQNMTFNSKTFTAAGEWSQWFFGAPIAMAYNKNLAASYGITELEEFVEDGGWTYEALYRIACEERTLNNDTDGNTVMNEKDFYAISVYSPALFGLFASAGGKFSTVDNNGAIRVNITDDMSQNRLEAIIEAFSSQTTFYSDDIKLAEKLFMENQSVFFMAPLGFFGDFLDVKFTYGILPCPKLNEGQKEYISCANPQSSFCVSLPNNLSEDEQKFVGLFLNAYGYASHKYVKPAKYDEFMQFRVASDPASAARMDQMFASLYYDINVVMNFGTSRTLLNNAIFNEDVSRYVNFVKKAEGTIQADINKFLAITQK